MLADALFLLVMGLCLLLMGTLRLSLGIRLLAVQGMGVSLLPWAVRTAEFGGWALGLALATFAVKGLVFPWLLSRAARDADVGSEGESFLGASLSWLAGVAGLGIFFWVCRPLDAWVEGGSRLALPAAFFSVLAGLFLIAARRQALHQVLGYLVMENGIFAFGSVMRLHQPWLVELGVLLDVLAAVLVMGILIFHIRQEFDHIDTHRLHQLRDWKQERIPPVGRSAAGAEEELF